jgi:Biotin-protein ligase, N terminal
MARVALYGSGGSPYHHAAAFAAGGAAFDFVFAADIAAGALAAYDGFVMPGGGYLAMQGQLEPLGPAGCRAIREYVEGGGMYVGSCAGSYSPADVPASFLAACPMQAELRLLDCRIWNGWDSPLATGLQSPGIGTLRAANASPGTR